MLQSILILTNKLLYFWVKLLLSSGAVVDKADNDGFTALMMAAEYGFLQAVQVR